VTYMTGRAVSHSLFTDWSDGAGPERTVWTASASWPADTDSGALTGRMALIYGSEGWGFESLRAPQRITRSQARHFIS